jgi:hypothetical protein
MLPGNDRVMSWFFRLIEQHHRAHLGNRVCAAPG